jgi:hypothetical protein
MLYERENFFLMSIFNVKFSTFIVIWIVWNWVKHNQCRDYIIDVDHYGVWAAVMDLSEDQSSNINWHIRWLCYKLCLEYDQN